MTKKYRYEVTLTFRTEVTVIERVKETRVVHHKIPNDTDSVMDYTQIFHSDHKINLAINRPINDIAKEFDRLRFLKKIRQLLEKKLPEQSEEQLKVEQLLSYQLEEFIKYENNKPALYRKLLSYPIGMNQLPELSDIESKQSRIILLLNKTLQKKILGFGIVGSVGFATFVGATIPAIMQIANNMIMTPGLETAIAFSAVGLVILIVCAAYFFPTIQDKKENLALSSLTHNKVVTEVALTERRGEGSDYKLIPGGEAP